MSISLGLVEETVLSFLFLLGPIPSDGRLACGTGGLAAVITGVQVGPCLWHASWCDMKSAASIVVLMLEVLEGVDIERG